MNDPRSAYVRSHGYRNYGMGVMDQMFITPVGARVVTLEQAIEEIEAAQRDEDQEDK